MVSLKISVASLVFAISLCITNIGAAPVSLEKRTPQPVADPTQQWEKACIAVGGTPACSTIAAVASLYGRGEGAGNDWGDNSGSAGNDWGDDGDNGWSGKRQDWGQDSNGVGGDWGQDDGGWGADDGDWGEGQQDEDSGDWGQEQENENSGDWGQEQENENGWGGDDGDGWTGDGGDDWGESGEDEDWRR